MNSNSIYINSSFRKEKKIWCEYSNDEKVFEFKQIDENENEIVLFDEQRNHYVKLCDSNAYWGSAPNDINKELNLGSWSSHSYKLVESEEKKLAWKKKFSDTYFYKHISSHWCEKQNGKIQFNFTEMIADDKEVVLFDEKRRMFVKLSNSTAFYGFNMTNIDKIIDHGSWLKVISIKFD